MALAQFACPHCSERFELAQPPVAGQTQCPRCHGLLAVSPASSSPKANSGAEFLPAAHEPESPESLAFNPDDVSALDWGRRQKAPPVARTVVKLTRQQKERRHQIRSLIWLIGGITLLAIAAAILGRQQ